MTEPAPPSSFDFRAAELRARARRTEFLERHNLKAFDACDANVVLMARQLQQDWVSGRIRSRWTAPKLAIPALARISSKYGSSGPPVVGREDFRTNFAVYGLRGTISPALLAIHVDVLGPSELAELTDWTAGGFDVRVEAEAWIIRTGVRVLIANPAALTLTPIPGPNPEYLPGPSTRPRHVRLRASLAGDSVRTNNHNLESA